MRSAVWDEAQSHCWENGPRHRPTSIIALDGRSVGHICEMCLDVIRQARLGSDLWMRVIPPEKD